MNPRVSVIIPIYNNEQYLEECLDSVVGQSLQEIEIICINDGSTDSSLAILEEYAARDARIRIIDKENSGYGASMNQGLVAATGDYIGIVESDDYIADDMYESLVKVADTHPDIDIVRADYEKFWGEGVTRTFEPVALSDKRAYYDHVFAPCEDPSALRIGTINQSGIYRREFLEKNKIVFNETPGASYQDNGFFFLVFALAHSALLMDGSYYKLRRDNEASSVNNPGKVYCMCEEYDHIRDEVLRRGLSADYLEMCAFKRYENYYWTEGRVAHGYKRAFCQRFSDDFRALCEQGEIEQSLFEPAQWRDLEFVMDDPDVYYFTRWVSGDRAYVNELTHRIDMLEHSNSWKVGNALMRIPSKVRKVLKKSPTEEMALPQKAFWGVRLDDSQSMTNLSDWFWRELGYVLDLETPRTFNEKMVWLRLHESELYPKPVEIWEEGALRYRVLCFSGKPEIIFIDTQHRGIRFRNIYDVEGGLLPITFGYPNFKDPITVSREWQEMLKQAALYAGSVPFTCVSFNVDESGSIEKEILSPFIQPAVWSPPELDYRIAQKIL